MNDGVCGVVLPRGYLGVLRGGVVSEDRNFIAGTIGDDIAFFIDNSDFKSMGSSINVSECNDSVTVDIANFSTVHQKFGAVP